VLLETLPLPVELAAPNPSIYIDDDTILAFVGGVIPIGVKGLVGDNIDVTPYPPKGPADSPGEPWP
jgi:hypothetical protein